MKRLVLIGAMACAVAASTQGSAAGGGEPRPNIGALAQWDRTSKLAEIRNGMLYLDALRTKDPVALFRKDVSLTEPDLTVEFKVESVGRGDRAFGLIFGSTDSATYHSVHITRNQVSLCRVAPGQGRLVLDSRGIFTRREGDWHTARVHCEGNIIRVFFDGKFLFSLNSPGLKPGNVGVYASDGRAWVRRLDYRGRPVRLPKAWKLLTKE